MNKALRTCLCLTLVMLLGLGALPALAAAPVRLATEPGELQFQINNNTGASITEVYIYPNYTTKAGDARNKGWIRSGQNAIVSVTSAEARRDCLWNFCLVFKPQNKRAFSVTWQDMELEYLLGEIVEVYVDDYGDYQLQYTEMGSGLEFDIYNDTGYIFTEVYVYHSNSSAWGKTRNTREINDQGKVHISLNATETGSNAEWNLHIEVRLGRSYYNITFEGVPLEDYNNGTMYVHVNSQGYWYLSDTY